MNALIVISGLGIAALIAEFANFKRWLPIIVSAGLIAAAVLIYLDLGTSSTYFQNMLVFDTPALAFSGLIITIALFWFLMSSSFFTKVDQRSDRVSLVMFVVAGGVLMCSFRNMAMLFLGIEILSMPLYVLAGSRKKSLASTEAAFKYFLMGSFATGFLLFGIALVYGATGSFDLANINAAIANGVEATALLYPGILLMLVGLAFKISAVPFHFWAPDVYDGAPTAITALMATVVKVAAIAAFTRVFVGFENTTGLWEVALQVMMILTLVVPNVIAVYQNNVKRMLAYSSVGHVGFLLLGFISGGEATTGVIFYYLTAYTFSSLAAFAVLMFIEQETGRLDISAFNGLSKTRPVLAAGMAIALMSLAGIPPLSGFFAKYMVLTAAVAHGHVEIAVLAVVASLVGVFYYFRIIVAMYFGDALTELNGDSLGRRILLLILLAIVIGSGLFPDLIIF